MFQILVFVWLGFTANQAKPVKQIKPTIITEDSVGVVGYAEVRIEAKGSIIWRITPLPIKKTSIGSVLIFAGLPGKTYEVEALVIDWEAKTTFQDFKRVKFAELSDPDPPVVPKEDNLVKDIRAAIKSDPDSSLIPKFVDLYSKVLEEGTGLIDKSTTYGAFEEGMKAEAVKLGLAGKAITYQTVVAKFARDNLPWQKSSDTTIDKRLSKQVFSKIKQSLEQALRSER